MGFSMAGQSRKAIEWLHSLKPEHLLSMPAAEHLRLAVAAVVARLERGEYQDLTGVEALVKYLDSLPDSVLWPLNLTAPYFIYGEPALSKRLLALPPRTWLRGLVSLIRPLLSGSNWNAGLSTIGR